jgi:hypothetical protein
MGQWLYRKRTLACTVSPCAAFYSLEDSAESPHHQQERPQQIWPPQLELPSLQNCEMNKPLFFVNCSVCVTQL